MFPVLVELSVRGKLFDHAKELVKIKDPLTAREAEEAKNPKYWAFTVKLLQVNAPIQVIVPVPELLSINTSSLAVGTDAPLEPPDVADQCVVVVASQVPEPPTQ